MSAEVQGLLKFVSNGMPAAMLERVQAMVAELAALGVSPSVTVTVELASTSRPSSSPISAAMDIPARGVGVTSTSPDPMPRSVEERSGIDGGERGATASAASMSAGEDFLGGEASSVKRQASGVDWSSGGPYLSSAAWVAVTDLQNGVVTWRQTKKQIRLELIQKVLAQPTESGKAMTMGEFDRRRPAWMPGALGLPTTFGCAWSELPGLRLNV